MDAAECHVALSVQSSEKCLWFLKWSHGWDHSAILADKSVGLTFDNSLLLSTPEFSSFLVLTLSIDRLPPLLSGMTSPVVTYYRCYYICLSLSKFWSPFSSILACVFYVLLHASGFSLFVGHVFRWRSS